MFTIASLDCHRLLDCQMLTVAVLNKVEVPSGCCYKVEVPNGCCYMERSTPCYKDKVKVSIIIEMKHVYNNHYLNETYVQHPSLLHKKEPLVLNVTLWIYVVH